MTLSSITTALKPSLESKRRLFHYVFSFVITTTCLALTVVIGGVIGRATHQLAVVAVVLSAWYGGMAPGLFSAAISGFGISFFLAEPHYSFAIAKAEDILTLMVFVVVAVVMSVLAEGRRKAELALRARTQELEAANKELEEFSYSVSHNLRSPLRVIDNYARMILENTSQTPEQMSQFVRSIRSSTQQMGQLVDDLLAFSRLGRQPLRKRATALSDLVRQSMEGLSTEFQDRKAEITIGDLPVCQGDPTLLKIVLENLLHNSLKFTRTREQPTIEIGSRSNERELVYYVKDNGVGFNMAYADQLFSMFQRLHREEDFEGTGVGLAIAQRIIQRHGGRIWAEAEIDKGATFYFTVKGEAQHV
ncbi:MAG: ATP-binding protein [Nitrospiraceae bacterium]